MRILLFCDDQYHPGEIPQKGVQPLIDKGYRIDIITDTTDFDPDIIFEYDVIIMSKSDHISQTNPIPWKTQSVQAAFVRYVEAGGGFIVSHSGTVRGDNTSTLDELIGCYFVSHPSPSHITVGPLKPHPITKGVEMFCEDDEHYHLKIIKDDIDILVSSYSAPVGNPDKYKTEPYENYPAYMAPAFYTRTQEKGRVCVFTPGHTIEMWLNKNYQRLLENTILWCAKQ